MKLFKSNDLYIWQGDYLTKDIPKNAGLRWNPEKKVWWTKSIDVAAKLLEYADDSCAKELSAYLTQKVDNIKASRAEDADIDLPVPEGLEYRPFQRAGIKYALSNRPSRGTLIGDEMGLGKTIQALGVMNVRTDINSVLVICPATARINWQREAQKWLLRPFNYFIINDTSGNIPANATFVITNYEKLLDNKVFNALMNRTWDCLIVDECHYLKNPKAQRTQKVLGYWDKRNREKIEGIESVAAMRIFLSGTPSLNRPLELHPVLACLCPSVFGNFMAFAKRYCDAYAGPWGWDFSGASNLQELQEKMRSTVMVRRLKKDVLKELPPKTRQVIVLPANGASEHVTAENDAYNEWEDKIAEAKSLVDLAHAADDMEEYQKAVNNLRQIVTAAFSNISRLRHQTALAKVPAMVGFINEILEQKDKVVVFAHHHDVIHKLEDEFKDICVVLTGEDQNMVRRQRVIDDFQNDPNVKVFIGSIKAAGQAINLTIANHVIFAELDWTPAILTQAEDRTHRIGQHDNVLIQHVVLDGSLDVRMAETIIDKQAVLDAALDAKPEEKEEPIVVTTEPEPVRPHKYPEATQEERDRVTAALRYLSSLCDGAQAIDGMGFNKLDTNIGKSLAAKSFIRPLTDGEVWLGAKVVRKYSKQLSPVGLDKPC